MPCLILYRMSRTDPEIRAPPFLLMPPTPLLSNPLPSHAACPGDGASAWYASLRRGDPTQPLSPLSASSSSRLALTSPPPTPLTHTYPPIPLSPPGDGASAWYASLLRGDHKAPTSVGAGSVIQERAAVHGSTIGVHSLIGAGASLSRCTVGNGVSIGMGAIIGAGASVGDGAVVAAGAVLPAGRSVPAGEVWAGAPAAKIGLASELDAEGITANVKLVS